MALYNPFGVDVPVTFDITHLPTMPGLNASKFFINKVVDLVVEAFMMRIAISGSRELDINSTRHANGAQVASRN